jgi:hypothetical protein
MSTVTPKSVARNALIGFAIGLVLMLGVGYGVSALTSTASASQAE